ncbi:hypothetical protein BH18ACI5_BH18ACI5_15020 [soil metagenome]
MMQGENLGPYQILAKVGEGGMGEVYRARHLTLDREVAIKVLPARLGADGTARERFEREARAVAALSHPNILAIHDFGVHDGVAYAVMELLRGTTLRERLDEGALPLRKLLQIGSEIADGLAAAHDKGIIHRDLKPENLFITADGHVKILDFGLARQAPGITADISGARTMQAATEPGMVMGTVGYMSPEQVRGDVADHRSDIFSLGCVLYELTAGVRAFARDTAAETMTAVLREDPPDASSVNAAARPAGLDTVIRHCLEKRPEERFQSARDLAFALRSLAGLPTSGQQVAVVAPPRSHGMWPLLALAAGVSGIALFAIGRFTVPLQTVGPQVESFTQVTDQAGTEMMPTLSPDGKSLVYSKTVGSDTDLYLLRIGSRTPVRLTTDNPTEDVDPAFSPDGEQIAFRTGRDGGGVFVMTASGESVRRLTDFGFSPSWSPDGSEIVVSPIGFLSPTALFASTQGMSIVNLKSGKVRPLAIDGRGLQPAWSPAGTRIAYWGVRGTGGQRDIWTVAADGSDAIGGGARVTEDSALDWSPTWSPDGRYLYFSSTRGGTMNLWRTAIDERSGQTTGQPEPVTTQSQWSGVLSFSRDGSRLAFASLDYRSTILRAPFDSLRGELTGAAAPIVKGTRPIRDHELSPDGQWITFTEAGVREDLFVARVDGSRYRRLTDDAFRDRGPAWSPDGSRIAFYSDRSGSYELWAVRPDGSGLVQLTTGTGAAGFPAWSPDGKTVAFGFDRWHLVNAVAQSTTTPVAEATISPTERFLPSSWSASGARIAGQVVGADGWRASVGVYDVSTKQFSRVPGDLATGAYWIWPTWLGDSRRLLIRRRDGIALVDAGTGEGRVVLLVGGDMIGRTVGVSRDGTWITYTETGTEGDIWIAAIKQDSGRAER